MTAGQKGVTPTSARREDAETYRALERFRAAAARITAAEIAGVPVPLLEPKDEC